MIALHTTRLPQPASAQSHRLGFAMTRWVEVKLKNMSLQGRIGLLLAMTFCFILTTPTPPFDADKVSQYYQTLFLLVFRQSVVVLHIRRVPEKAF
jgi:hypothetical protein